MTAEKTQQVTAPTKNWRFSASYDSFVVAQTFVLRMNICGKNRQLLVAANRYPTFKKTFQMKIKYAVLIFSSLFLLTLQSCSEEDSYFDLTDEAKELILFEVGDTFDLKNIETDETITLIVDWKEFDYRRDGPTPGDIYGGIGGDNYYETGEYYFTDETNCYTGNVMIEARSNGNFEFSITLQDCFGENLTIFNINNFEFEHDGVITSININGVDYPETYILNTVNNTSLDNTIFYSKENGIIQIDDNRNQLTIFEIAE